MIIDCVADLHGEYPKLKGGDLLIIAGDCTTNDKVPAWKNFFDWLDKQPYKHKVMIAGNHDNFCRQWVTSDDSVYDSLLDRPSLTYLCDSGTEIEGFKIWGSPWSPYFKGINPHCMAFTEPDEFLEQYWRLIPDDTDILITHCPPFGFLDQIKMRDGSRFHAGSKTLLDRLKKMKQPPELWVFGHIHEGYGQFLLPDSGFCKMINCSYMNEDYEPVNKPIRVIL